LFQEKAVAASNLANLPAPPPMGSIQFFDGYFPALDAKTYTITLKHTVSGNSGAPAPFTATQTVTVQAPEFFIDPGIVQSFYPPNGSSDIYAEKLPFIVLTDPSLPWERGLVPNHGEPDPANPTAWMALLILAESEVRLPESSNNPVTTTTVGTTPRTDFGGPGSNRYCDKGSDDERYRRARKKDCGRASRRGARQGHREGEFHR